jgi:hypothetical protein
MMAWLADHRGNVMRRSEHILGISSGILLHVTRLHHFVAVANSNGGNKGLHTLGGSSTTPLGWWNRG